MGWRITDVAEDDARQQAADFNVTFNQYWQHDHPIAEKSARRSRWSQRVCCRRTPLPGESAAEVVGPGTASRPTSHMDQSC
jgi:hypothetical protein